MSFSPLKITFYLDGTGVYFNSAEPLHLDALLCFAAAAHHCSGEAPARDEIPMDVPIPVAKWHIADSWGWCCSALFPAGNHAASLQYWRKRFRRNRVELTTGSPNLTNATYRDHNMPMPLVLCHMMEAWCLGDRRRIRRELVRNINHLGRKGSMGKGRINDITVERVDKDFSLVRDGLAQRWLPDPGGARRCRPRPPYWNYHCRTNLCEVGAPYDEHHKIRITMPKAKTKTGGASTKGGSTKGGESSGGASNR